MKTRNIHSIGLLLGLLAIMLAACQQEDKAPEPGSVVRLTAAIDIEASGTIDMTRATDATESQNRYFDANTYLQVYVYAHNTYNPVMTLDGVTIEGGSMYKTAAYVVREGQTINVMDIADVDKEPSFLNNPAVDIVAVHPIPSTATFTATASNPFTFSVQTTQTTKAAYKISDLMVATATNQTSQENPIALPFGHKMAKITITFIPGNGTPVITKAEILGIQPTVTFNCQTGAVSAATGTATAITIYDDSDGTDSEYTTSAIVPQQAAKAANTDFVRFTFLGGGTVTYKLPSATTLTAGNNYIYNLTVNATAVTATGSITTAWEEGESRDYSADGGTNEKIGL